MKIISNNEYYVFNSNIRKDKITNQNSKNNSINFKNYSSNNTSYLSFKGSQRVPFTDEDYNNAKKNIPSLILEAKKKKPGHNYFNLYELDNLERINGIQKGIKVFDGLTINEIAFILKSPKVLLNRCCSNNCIHCAYMATPSSDKTLDKISYEDFVSLIDGISELQNRVGENIIIADSIGTFYDSDCMEIELKDRNGNVYDYIDCIELLNSKKLAPPIFDTSGWNPKSKKHQKRAEKFVEYLQKPQNSKKISQLNISINPFHIIFAKAMELKSKFRFIKAKKMEENYVDRMANMLFTFTPLQDTDVHWGVLARAIPENKTKTKYNYNALYRLQIKIIDALAKRYKQDLMGENKFIKNSNDLNRYLEFYKRIIMGTEEYPSIDPIGRAESFFNDSEIENPLEERKKSMIKGLDNDNIKYYARLINPNGKILLLNDDISVETDLELNFENKGKVVKPFAHQITGYIYTAQSGMVK